MQIINTKLLKPEEIINRIFFENIKGCVQLFEIWFRSKKGYLVFYGKTKKSNKDVLNYISGTQRKYLSFEESFIKFKKQVKAIKTKNININQKEWETL